jgi:hypothetical protein
MKGRLTTLVLATAALAVPGAGAVAQASAHQSAPRTTLTKRPLKRTYDRTPTFAFKSDQPGYFECSFEGRGFRVCRSPLTIRPLVGGRYELAVRAVTAAGEADPSPASFSFTVLPQR